MTLLWRQPRNLPDNEVFWIKTDPALRLGHGEPVPHRQEGLDVEAGIDRAVLFRSADPRGDGPVSRRVTHRDEPVSYGRTHLLQPQVERVLKRGGVLTEHK